jgi:hypothetical protein
MAGVMGQTVDAGAPNNTTTTAYATSLVAKASPGRLTGLSGYNSGSAGFIQVHDAASLPANTAVPAIVIAVPATGNFALDLGLRGRYFATGIVIAYSSTGPTLTIGSAVCWIDAQTL